MLLTKRELLLGEWDKPTPSPKTYAWHPDTSQQWCCQITGHSWKRKSLFPLVGRLLFSSRMHRPFFLFLFFLIQFKSFIYLFNHSLQSLFLLSKSTKHMRVFTIKTKLNNTIWLLNLFKQNGKIYIFIRRCPWCNGYHHRKWTRQHEFKSWTRLIAFLQPWWGN